MHRNAKGLTREEIVQQVRYRKDASLYDWKAYIPVGNAAKKLQAWKRQGAEIFYLTSRTKLEEVEEIKKVLERHGFPEGQLLFKRESEEYNDVAERIMPDIIVEDDCESIGGADQMTYTHIKPELKKRIRLIAVKEFGGIDHLPDNILQK